MVGAEGIGAEANKTAASELRHENESQHEHQGRARVASQKLSTHGLELGSEMRQEVIETVSLLVNVEPRTTGAGPTDIRPQRVELTQHLRYLLGAARGSEIRQLGAA